MTDARIAAAARAWVVATTDRKAAEEDHAATDGESATRRDVAYRRLLAAIGAQWIAEQILIGTVTASEATE